MPDMKDRNLSPEELENLTRLNRVASARRIVNLSLFTWLAAAAFEILSTPIAPLFVLASLVVSLIGVARLTSALGIPILWQGLSAAAMFLPVLNWVVMGLHSMRATKFLRAAGFTVGLFQSRQASDA